MSTNDSKPTGTVDKKQFANRAWRLHPAVALRPEPFGALAYHYHNRKLNFVRSHSLVEVLGALEAHPSPRHAFESAGLPAEQWPAFSSALASLARSSFIVPMTTSTPVSAAGC